MNPLSRDFGPLLREMHLRAAERREPVNGTFELTNRCNLACAICYVRQGASQKILRNPELSPATWIALAKEARDNGMAFLLLTGGEVLLRPDFFDIYEPLTRIGLVITLFTNGTLISEAVAKRLAQAPPSSVEITLYGASAATYESVTGVQGSYARCCAGIEALLAQRIPLGLKTTLTRKNLNELPAMREMARSWGVPFSVGWLLSKRRDGVPSGVDSHRVSAEECLALELAGGSHGFSAAESALREILPDDNARNFFCLAGKSAFLITPDGEMNICLDLAMPAARPLDIGFMAAWKEVQRFADSAPAIASECLACEARGYCPRCPAWSWQETKTFTAPVPYLCDIAELRKARYGNV